MTTWLRLFCACYCLVCVLSACVGRVAEQAPIAPTQIDKRTLYKVFSPPFTEAQQFSKINNHPYQEYQLNNGLKVNLVPLNTALFTNIRLITINSDQHQTYLADFVNAYLRYGSQHLPDQNFINAIAVTGAEFRYQAYPDFNQIAISVMHHDRDLTLQLLASNVTKPNFDPSKIEKVRLRLALNNKVQSTINSQLAEQAFMQLLYGSQHPYGKKRNANADRNAVDVERIKQYYENNYGPSNSYLIIAGQIDNQEKLLANIASWFDWPTKKIQPYTQSFTPKKIAQTIYFIDRDNAQQVDIVAGTFGKAKADPSWMDLFFLSKMLGGGSHSRLFNDVREQRGLTYSIRASMPSRRQLAPFSITTSTAHHKVAAMLSAIMQHKTLLATQPMDTAEFEMHKTHLLGRLTFGRETPEEHALRRVRYLVYGQQDNYLVKYQDYLHSLNPESLYQRNADFLSQDWLFVLVGDYERAKDQLKQFFPNEKLILLSDDLSKID